MMLVRRFAAVATLFLFWHVCAVGVMTAPAVADPVHSHDATLGASISHRSTEQTPTRLRNALGLFRSAVDTVSDTVLPLTELGIDMYNGYGGGLYPGGTNIPPPAHLAAGLAAAAAIAPLDSTGTVDRAKGRIVLLSIGMSNTTQEYSTFRSLTDTFMLKNPSLVVLDGAQGGQTASIIADTSANFWQVIDQRLRNAGVSRNQVQVVWLKEANAGPVNGFPRYALDLMENLRTIVRALPARYPNLRIVYLSSRIFGGWATTALNPEMYAYESGFSVKWLIEQQIDGDSSLSYQGPDRKAPWLAWGPYLWANGLHPRAVDGLTWEQSDFGTDGTHPGASGRLKVARMLLDFFSTDSTSTPWFLRAETGDVTSSQDDAFDRLVCYPTITDRYATVRYTMARRGPIRLDICDVNGGRISTLVNDVRETGVYQEGIDLNDRFGSPLPSGLYFVRMQLDTATFSTRIILIR